MFRFVRMLLFITMMVNLAAELLQQGRHCQLVITPDKHVAEVSAVGFLMECGLIKQPGLQCLFPVVGFIYGLNILACLDKLGVEVRVIGVCILAGLLICFRGHQSDRRVIQPVFASMVILLNWFLFCHESHYTCSKSSTSSSTELKVLTLPALMSSSASLSPSCHLLVQK